MNEGATRRACAWSGRNRFVAFIMKAPQVRGGLPVA